MEPQASFFWMFFAVFDVLIWVETPNKIMQVRVKASTAKSKLEPRSGDLSACVMYGGSAAITGRHLPDEVFLDMSAFRARCTCYPLWQKQSIPYLVFVVTFPETGSTDFSAVFDLLLGNSLVARLES